MSDQVRGVTVTHNVTHCVTNCVRILVTLRHYHNLRGAGHWRLVTRVPGGEVSVGEGGPEISLLIIVIRVLKWVIDYKWNLIFVRVSPEREREQF